MNTKFIAFLSLLLVFTLTAAPVFAEDESYYVEFDTPRPATAHGPYTMTQTAHVLASLKNGADADQLVVWFDEFTPLKKGDKMPQLQRIPDNLIGMHDIYGELQLLAPMPGQEVKITFTYQMRDYTTFDGRSMEILSCDKIQVVGKTILPISYTKIKKNKHIGTVIQASGNQLTVYVEGTYVYDGSREHIAYGSIPFKTGSNTKLFTKDNRSVPLTALKPFQRVEIEVDPETETFMDFEHSLEPPQYAGGVAKVIRVLEYGHEMVSCDDNTRSIRMVVEEQRKTGGAVTSLIVKPASAYHRHHLPKAELFQPSAPGVAFSAYTRGTVIDVTYMAVDNTAEIPAYYYITKVKPASKKMSEQEISGVFGKEGDVVIRVDSTTLSPDDKKIKATWINKTNTNISCSHYYLLDVKKDGKWEEYRNDEYYVDFEGMEDIYVKANSEERINFDVEMWTNKLEKGTYRIAAEFEADGSYIVTSNEFTVK